MKIFGPFYSITGASCIIIRPDLLNLLRWEGRKEQTIRRERGALTGVVRQGPGRGPFQAVEGREVVALPLAVAVVFGQQSLVIGHLGGGRNLSRLRNVRGSRRGSTRTLELTA